jgi:hypothetical protein
MAVLVYFEIAVMPGHLMTLVSLHVVVNRKTGRLLADQAQEGRDGRLTNYHNYKQIMKTYDIK